MTMIKSLRGPLVLVVQSNLVAGMAVAGQLQRHGFTVSGPFDDCGLALFRLTRDHPDAAIVDQNLRNGSSASLVAELFHRNIPFLVHTEAARRGPLPEYFRGIPWIARSSPAQNSSPAQDLMQEKLVQAVGRLLVKDLPAQNKRAESMRIENYGANQKNYAASQDKVGPAADFSPLARAALAETRKPPGRSA